MPHSSCSLSSGWSSSVTSIQRSAGCVSSTMRFQQGAVVRGAGVVEMHVDHTDDRDPVTTDLTDLPVRDLALIEQRSELHPRLLLQADHESGLALPEEYTGPPGRGSFRRQTGLGHLDSHPPAPDQPPPAQAPAQPALP